MSDTLKDYARKLVELSLDTDGQPSSERVAAVLAALAENPPSRYRALLQQYSNYLDIEVRRSQALIEYAGPAPEAQVAEIVASLSARYGRKLSPVLQNNETLLGGIRVRVGDDVYDSSVATRLKQLRQAAI